MAKKKTEDDDDGSMAKFPGGAKIVGYCIPDLSKTQAATADEEDLRPMPVFFSEKGLYKTVYKTLVEAREAVEKKYGRKPH